MKPNKKILDKFAELDVKNKQDMLQQLGLTSEYEISLKDLHKLLRSKVASSKIREIACFFIMAIHNRKSTGVLLEAFDDKDAGLSNMVMLALAVIRSGKALKVMIETLRFSPDHEKRRQAAYILQRYSQDERAINALIEALNDKNQSNETRAQAAEGLGTLSATRATSTLVAHLHDPSAEIRAECIWSLGQVGMDIAIIPELEKFIGDKSNAGIMTIEEEAKESIKFIKARNMALEKYTGDKSSVTIWDIHTETLEIAEQMEAAEALNRV